MVLGILAVAYMAVLVIGLTGDDGEGESVEKSAWESLADPDWFSPTPMSASDLLSNPRECKIGPGIQIAQLPGSCEITLTRSRAFLRAARLVRDGRRGGAIGFETLSGGSALQILPKKLNAGANEALLFAQRAKDGGDGKKESLRFRITCRGGCNLALKPIRP